MTDVGQVLGRRGSRPGTGARRSRPSVTFVGDDLGAEPHGLRAHVGHQVGAHDAVGEAREVLDLGGQHELSAGLIAGTRRFALDQQG